ncbi:hypothetical protein AZO1586I_1695 [Bathymodiolus thermophilus thioautotrophic gill symbiont]|jgi:hypothetical protein|uniref:Uncharacterized protein n=3 Tax=Gammaproteobacteria incertae sedis TaxID=118884 RepID=A0ACA8ZV45_9GAMM|nr:hypothetical protein AZO1586I_176 [Bathymodiolus thermophilus thioautotrophic gill symbiont]CAB5506537.1 hypothetical protein AZO1586R_2099 [Bathymodiolus azoricus thioautotrophic gill symbiont]CAC5832528.1 hypothetical protein [uncultured Gammaproteobacteria bacterium]CAB5498256.1 hypothetical protein AZO1586I_306 [Bathymodiolus thermophilus thioautotrophic gill symbiont]CAB5498298.1 hypothetical protein AZO1586I_311 [Bathymodiolus thermophilus thioautotrophic gill symbiont]
MAILFINRDRKMTDTESRKLEADIVKTMAHTMELGAETAKLNKETFCYPVALSTGLVISVGAVVKYFL